MKAKIVNFLNCKNWKELVGKSVLLLVLPYAWLIFCGLVFDKLLKWYFMTTFIFFSLIALYLLAIVAVVFLIVGFVKKNKK